MSLHCSVALRAYLGALRVTYTCVYDIMLTVGSFLGYCESPSSVGVLTNGYFYFVVWILWNCCGNRVLK